MDSDLIATDGGLLGAIMGLLSATQNMDKYTHIEIFTISMCLSSYSKLYY
jgi:hypothetical protein